jgi:tRNA A-37 threonylcarbamoyl transferase component Bud32
MTNWTHLCFGGLRWEVHPAWCERLFDRDGLRLREWQAARTLHVVKQAAHRTILQVKLPEEPIYIKHYPVHSLRAVVRQRLRPAKARTEFELALALARRAVPTIQPVAIAETSGGESYFVTRALQDTQRLDVFLDRLIALPPYSHLRELRWKLAEGLACFFALLHDAGVEHRDLHAGNILIHPESLQLYLIDLHAVRLRPPLDWPTARDNITQLSSWFLGRSTRSDRLRFWQHYSKSRRDRVLSAATHRKRALELEHATKETCARIWHTRLDRCLTRSRHFYHVKQADRDAWAVTDVPRALLESLLADPDRPFACPAAHVLKQGRSSSVAGFSVLIDGGVRQVIWKRFNVTGPLDPLINCLRRTPALRSWVNGHALLDRGLPTPRPLVLVQRRRHGLKRECYLMTEKFGDAVNLRDYALELLGRLSALAAGQRTELHRVIERVAGLVRGMHDRGISHRDLKALNILVERTRQSIAVDHAVVMPFHEAPRLFLIDLVGVTCGRSLTRRRMIQNLTRLHASFHDEVRITRGDKLRFLRSYLRWGVHGKRGWKRWWREIAAATEAKVARNAHRGRPLA